MANYREPELAPSVGEKTFEDSHVITIWGRANSVNVQKVLWLCVELALAYSRIDAGLQFGRNTEADYLAMNATGKIPTLVDGDFALWTGDSIWRFGSALLGPTTRPSRSSDTWPFK